MKECAQDQRQDVRIYIRYTTSNFLADWQSHQPCASRLLLFLLRPSRYIKYRHEMWDQTANGRGRGEVLMRFPRIWNSILGQAKWDEMSIIDSLDRNLTRTYLSSISDIEIFFEILSVWLEKLHLDEQFCIPASALAKIRSISATTILQLDSDFIDFKGGQTGRVKPQHCSNLIDLMCILSWPAQTCPELQCMPACNGPNWGQFSSHQIFQQRSRALAITKQLCHIITSKGRDNFLSHLVIICRCKNLRELISSLQELTVY